MISWLIPGANCSIRRKGAGSRINRAAEGVPSATGVVGSAAEVDAWWPEESGCQVAQCGDRRRWRRNVDMRHGAGRITDHDDGDRGHAWQAMDATGDGAGTQTRHVTQDHDQHGPPHLRGVAAQPRQAFIDLFLNHHLQPGMVQRWHERGGHREEQVG